MAKIFTESFKLKGEEVIRKIKELIKEGNVRKITIHNEEGKEVMSFPINVGLVGIVFAPVLAAVGAAVALLTECTITVERENDDDGFEEAEVVD